MTRRAVLRSAFAQDCRADIMTAIGNRGITGCQMHRAGRQAMAIGNGDGAQLAPLLGLQRLAPGGFDDLKRRGGEHAQRFKEILLTLRADLQGQPPVPRFELCTMTSATLILP